MSDTRSAEAPDTARHAFRAAARAVARDTGNTTHHLARLAAALQLPGAEPVQGALADLFRGVGPEGVAVRRAALQMAAPRLAEHIRRSFSNRVAAQVLPAVTPERATDFFTGLEAAGWAGAATASTVAVLMGWSPGCGKGLRWRGATVESLRNLCKCLPREQG